MRSYAFASAVAAGLWLFGAGAAFGQEPSVRSDFEDCVASNKATEFESANALLLRISSSCVITGATRVRARGDATYGDTLRYDADAERLFWVVRLDPRQNALAGGNISPVGRFQNQAAFRALSGEQRRTLDRLGNSVRFLLEVGAPQADATRSYEASNAFGARAAIREIRGVRYSVALPAGGNTTGLLELAAFSVPADRIRESIQHLDTEFVWTAEPPCDVCYRGGEVPRGTIGAPTLSNPDDIQIMHRFVYVRLFAIRLVDRRTGAVIATQAMGGLAP